MAFALLGAAAEILGLGTSDRFAAFQNSLLTPTGEHSHRNKTGDDRGEERSNHKQQFAGTLPDLPESRCLRKNVDDICGAIGDVSQYSEQEHAEAEIDSQGRFGLGMRSQSR